MPGRKITRATCEQFQTIIKARQNRLWLEQFDSCGGKLKGERQPIEAAADFGDGGGVVFRQAKGGMNRLRASNEQDD
jgi:hypothetical protein